MRNSLLFRMLVTKNRRRKASLVHGAAVVHTVASQQQGSGLKSSAIPGDFLLFDDTGSHLSHAQCLI